MAIAYARPQIIGRKTGRSAVACAAYRAGEKLRDEKYGKTHDYEPRSGVIAQGVLTPAHAPEWMRDREQLWNAVERREDRSTRPDDAQLAREFVIALPHELDDQAREYLLKNILKEGATRKGMVADYAIHGPDAEGDHRNHHAHVMLTLREIDPDDADGFGNKARDWNGKQELAAFKNIIERETNKMLARHGIEERVTFQWEEGREAQRHMGQAATQLERQGQTTELGDTNRAIQERNRELDEARAELDEAQRPAHDPGLAVPGSRHAFALGDYSQVTRLDSDSPAADTGRLEPKPHDRPDDRPLSATAADTLERELAPDAGEGYGMEGNTADVSDGVSKGVGGVAELAAQIAERALGGMTSLLEGMFGASTAPPSKEERQAKAEALEDAREARAEQEKRARFLAQMEDSERQSKELEYSRGDGGRERTRER